jgi:hypothetical protein
VDSQWSTEVAAWAEGNGSYVQSFHFTFPAESAIVQIGLSSRADSGIGGAELVLHRPDGGAVSHRKSNRLRERKDGLGSGLKAGDGPD